jgi:hypothetical protein
MAQENQLVVLGADADIVAVVETLLFSRHISLGICELSNERVTLIKDGFHDASTPKHVAELLQTFSETHERALVIRDFEGSGYENEGIAVLEREIKNALTVKGWSLDRIEVIAVEPEIEAWLRLDSSHFEELVRNERKANAGLLSAVFKAKVKEIIMEQGGFLENGKPLRPKEAFEAILARYKIPNSASLFRKLGSKESLRGCSIPSFTKLATTLQAWFPLVRVKDAAVT